MKEGTVPVKVLNHASGQTLDRNLTPTEIACLEGTHGYTVTKVSKPVFLKPRVPPRGSEEEKTAQGKQWWQED